MQLSPRAVHLSVAPLRLKALDLLPVALHDAGALLGAHSCSSAMASSYSCRNSGSKNSMNSETLSHSGRP